MKRALLLTVQAAVTVTILWFVFRDPTRRAEMAAAIVRADPWWMTLGVIVGSLTYLAGAIRFGILLRAQAIHLRWRRVFGVYFVGQFFNLFALGATGGDVVKIFYVVRETPDKKTAAAFTVLMDRIVGLFALICMTGVILSLRYHWLIQTDAAKALVATLITVLGASFAFIALAAFLVLTGLSSRLPAWTPARAKILELVRVFEDYARHPAALLAAFGLSLVAHGAMFFTFYAAARSLGATVTVLDTCAVMPIVNTMIALPVSVAGVGVREKIFQTLLGDLCGVPGGVAVAIAVLGFTIGVLYSLIGGVVYLLFQRDAPAPTAEPALP